MTRRIAYSLLATLFAATAVAAQGAPPRTGPVEPPPPPVVTPAPAPPPANAVALCTDGTFVVAPGTPAACATRGGLKVVLPAPRATPAPPSAPAAESRAEERATPANAAPPAGASMRCKDGTYLSGPPSADRCAANGGLAVILPAPAVAPPPPRPGTR